MNAKDSPVAPTTDLGGDSAAPADTDVAEALPADVEVRRGGARRGQAPLEGDNLQEQPAPLGPIQLVEGEKWFLPWKIRRRYKSRLRSRSGTTPHCGGEGVG